MRVKLLIVAIALGLGLVSCQREEALELRLERPPVEIPEGAIAAEFS